MVCHCAPCIQRTSVLRLSLQACNLRSCTTALASLSSGRILAFAGWDAVNVLIFPLVAVAGGLLIWLARREGRAGQG